jgi:hypothetical protein
MFSCGSVESHGKDINVADKSHLKELIVEKDSWTYAEGKNDGLPFQLRFRNNLESFIKTNHYKSRFIIIWNYDSSNFAGMPVDKDLILMGKMENLLVADLEDDLQAVLSFVYTTKNQKEWHWYSTDISETGSRTQAILSTFGKLPITLNSKEDPDWSEYKSVLKNADTIAFRKYF